MKGKPRGNELGSISDGQNTNGQNKQNSHNTNGQNENINVLLFLVNLGLGLFYLCVALTFTMAIYLIPLASEDLFNYLFNVIQFMIVVVSTQFAYEQLKSSDFRRVINKVMHYNDHDHVPSTKNFADKTGHFLAMKLNELISQKKEQETRVAEETAEVST
jgi:hypothetical protein